MKIILSLTICAICCWSSAEPLPATNDLANSKLLNYLLLAQNSTNNSQTFTQCFNKYLPLLTELSNTFSTQYQACLTLNEQQTTNLYSQLTVNRTVLYQDAQAVCNAFQSCQSIFDAATFFSCLQTAATESIPRLYNISSAASQMFLMLSNSLQSIQAQRDQCKSTTEQTYTTQSTALYAELDNCLRRAAPAAATATDFQAKNESSQCPELVDRNTKIVCEAANATVIRIEIADGGAEIANQTGFKCQLIGLSLNTTTSEATNIACDCGNKLFLLVKTPGNTISMQTNSNNDACNCSMTNNNFNGTIPTMPTMPTFTIPTMPTMPTFTIPTMPTMPTFTMPTMPPMPTMPTMPPMRPFN